MKLKIMEYNIRKGFYSNDYKTFQKERKDAVVKIVNKESPDILVILEATFFKGNSYAKKKFGIEQDFQEMFNYPFIAVGSSPGKEGGMVILSKMKLKSRNFCKPRRQYVRLWAELNGRNLVIDAIHPSGRLNEEQKYQFIKNINMKKTNYILLGDFNALSPKDEYSEERLLKGFKKFDKDYKKTVSDFLERRVISYILNKDMVDSYKGKKFECTMPTNLISKSKLTAMRIDYIFSSKDIKINKFRVIKNKLTEKASDHYPITCVIEI